MERTQEGNQTAKELEFGSWGLEAPKSAAAGRVWGHVRLRWGKIGGKGVQATEL